MIEVKDNTCDYCSTCITICPPDCIEVRESSIIIDNDTCIDCNLCVEICPILVLSNSNEN